MQQLGPKKGCRSYFQQCKGNDTEGGLSYVWPARIFQSKGSPNISRSFSSRPLETTIPVTLRPRALRTVRGRK